MPLLQPCTEFWGRSRIVEDDPEIATCSDAIYLPYAPGGSWGLFAADGRIVRAATDFREEAGPSHDQVVADIDPDTAAPPGRIEPSVIYGGCLSNHYGHFLVNSLPRLWAMARLRTPSTKILCHAGSQPRAWFHLPFAAAILSALGLRIEDFVVPVVPTRLRTVVVPDTSFREQSAGHRVYGTFCREIAGRLMHGQPQGARGGFAYLSKSRLHRAVGLIENESEIDAALSARGVAILHPEQLSLHQQIAVFRDYDCILGSSGSALHTSLFHARSRIVCLNVAAQINTNFTIIDALAGNAAAYHYPPAMRVNPSRLGVLTSRTLPDAPAVAEALYAAANA